MHTPLRPDQAPGLDALLAGLPSAVVVAGPDNRLLHANPAFFSLSECTAADLGHMNFLDVLGMYCLSLCDSIEDFLAHPGFWHDVDKPLARADGSLAWVRVRVDALDLPGLPGCRRLVVDDITRYRVAMEGLQSRKNLYQSIVETRPDLICCFLPDWSLTYANAASARFFGKEREDIVGEDFLGMVDPSLRERFGQAASSITLDNPIAELEYQESRGEGDGPRFMRWIIQGFFYKTGHIKDYQATGLDVTAQKVTESQFIHADRLVSLGTLVSEVAHEISNPNNFIMLNAPLVLDLWNAVSPGLVRLAREEGGLAGGIPVEDVARDVPRLLQGIVEGSVRIRDFVRELKNFARQDAESGFETLSVNDVVQSAVLLMSKTIGQHTSRFSVRYGAGLPLVRGRRQRLEQIMVNLVQNACHALEGPHKAIEIATLHDESDGSVRMVVRDEGVGIRAEDLERVTEPFYSTKRAQGGTGLGLSISLSIAREHGGRLILESERGRGVTATVALPAATPESSL